MHYKVWKPWKNVLISLQGQGVQKDMSRQVWAPGEKVEMISEDKTTEVCKIDYKESPLSILQSRVLMK